MKESNDDLLQFVNVILMLNLLDESINRKELELDVTEIIKSFGSEYEELTNIFGVRVTNKGHVIVEHQL